MNIGKRIQIEGPDFSLSWKQWLGGHGGDEYGNCSVYVRCALFGIVFFWDPHYQDKVELPLNYGPCICSCGRCGPIDKHDCGTGACRPGAETQVWRRWYGEKFEGGEDLWG